MRDSAREVQQIVERGVERYGLGDVAGAAEAFRQAALLKPDDLRVRAYLAWVEFRLRGEQAPAADDEAQALASAIALGLISGGQGEAQAAGGDDEPTLNRYPDELPSLGGPSEAAATLPRRRRRDADADGEPPTLVRDPRNEAEEDPTGVYRLGQPWNEPTPIGARALHDAEMEREFISRVPTAPNLAPLDVPELTDEAVQALAAAAGVQLPPVVLPPPNAPEVVEMVAEPEGEAEEPPAAASPSATGEVLIEVVDPDDDPRATLKRGSPESADNKATLPRPATPVKPLAQPRPKTTDPLVAAARDAVDRGDFAGAFDAAEALVEAVGGIDAPELIAYKSLLGQIYEQQLGDLERIVVVARVPQALDPRAAFLLSRVDGLLTLEDLHDVSGMPWLEAIRLLALLLKQGALALR